MTLDELNVLLNSWPEDTVGYKHEQTHIALLDALGKDMGYGALAQMAQWLYEVQCNHRPENAANMKRLRFDMLGWPLPKNFDEVANR